MHVQKTFKALCLFRWLNLRGLYLYHANMLNALIAFLMSNFTLTFFLISVLLAMMLLLLRRNQLDFRQGFEIVFSQFLLWNIGVSYLYNFVMHVFFGDMAAAFIGWANSPFQLEVGFASLGFGVIGLMAFRASLPFRAAAIIGPTCFLWGAAGGHIYQMFAHHDFSSGNAGIIFWTDLLLPMIALFLLWKQKSLA